MNEIRVHRSAAAVNAIREVLRELAADFEGTLDDHASGEVTLSFPLRHRFFIGALVVRIRWAPSEESMVFRGEVDSSGAGFTRAGKSLLMLGTLATIPPVFCWYFPVLLPLVPLSLVLVFLAWLGAVRRPAYFTPEFHLRRMQTELSRLRTEEKQAEG